MCNIKSLTRLLSVPVLILGTLLTAQNAFAVQASGSVSILPSDNTLEQGQILTAVIRVTNTSSETGAEGVDPVPATLLAGGAITVTLACVDSTCATQIPNTLEFMSQGTNGCVSSDAGVSGCSASGDNQVIVNIGSNIVIPAGSFITLATIQLEAENAVLDPATGNFSQRAATGDNDLEAESIANPALDSVTGGASGSTSYLFPGVCDVQVDKQVSCDGGATWQDAGLVDDNNDGTNGCSTANPNEVMVRYQVRNTGDYTLVSCSLTESNPEFGTEPAVSDLAPGATSSFLPAAAMPACIDAVDDEPNTASVSCECAGFDPVVEVGASDMATFACEPLDLKTDRAVDCGDGYVDQTLVKMNEDTTLGCMTTDGNPVNWEYQACNDSAVTLYDCTLVDQNTAVSDAIIVGNLAAGECLSGIQATNNPVLCSDELEASEAPDQGRVDLQCCTVDVDGIANCTNARKRISVWDVSTVTCKTPGLEVTKECVDVNEDRIDEITITANNNGEVDLIDCVPTDEIYLEDETCDAPSGPATELLVLPNPFDIAAGGSQPVTGEVGPLDAPACNTASVTCTLDDGTGNTITAGGNAVCPGEPEQEGCLTRTPGYWGNHPKAVKTFVGDGTTEYPDDSGSFPPPMTICGVPLDTVNVGNSNSETSVSEAICSVGKDHKVYDPDNPQLAQLIRQCTAASLNFRASEELGGNCASPGDFPMIDEHLAACCGFDNTVEGSGNSICTGESIEGYDMEQCIYLLDTFNNDEYDTLELPKYGKANSRKCRDARNNGKVIMPVPE